MKTFAPRSISVAVAILTISVCLLVSTASGGPIPRKKHSELKGCVGGLLEVGFSVATIVGIWSFATMDRREPDPVPVFERKVEFESEPVARELLSKEVDDSPVIFAGYLNVTEPLEMQPVPRTFSQRFLRQKPGFLVPKVNETSYGFRYLVLDKSQPIASWQVWNVLPNQPPEMDTRFELAFGVEENLSVGNFSRFDRAKWIALLRSSQTFGQNLLQWEAQGLEIKDVTWVQTGEDRSYFFVNGTSASGGTPKAVLFGELIEEESNRFRMRPGELKFIGRL